MLKHTKILYTNNRICTPEANAPTCKRKNKHNISQPFHFVSSWTKCMRLSERYAISQIRF